MKTVVGPASLTWVFMQTSFCECNSIHEIRLNISVMMRDLQAYLLQFFVVDMVSHWMGLDNLVFFFFFCFFLLSDFSVIVLINGEHLSLLMFCFLSFFHFLFHDFIYVIPVQGQTNPAGQIFDPDRKLLFLLTCRSRNSSHTMWISYVTITC